MAKNDKVRILVGTRKGTYIVESDRKRKEWKVVSQAHKGSEVFHVVADPRHPGHIYAGVNSWMWGPTVERSTNWGKKWEEIGTPLSPKQKERPPTFDGNPDTPAPVRPFKNIWHIEPGSPKEPDSLYLGADPHFLFRSSDLGKSWEAVESINNHPDHEKWSPGAGGPCLHTILIDPRDPQRLFIGMSAVGTFRSENGGKSWKPVNKGVECPFLPEGMRFPETGQCVHKVVAHASNPETFYRQDHGGMYVSHDGMDSWTRIGKPLGDDFGFCVASPRADPDKAYFVQLAGESRLTEQGYFQVHEWNDKTRKWRKTLGPKDFPGMYGVHREGMAADNLDPAGIYVGTTTGQLFLTADGGKKWKQVPYTFPGIHSVSIANPD